MSQLQTYFGLGVVALIIGLGGYNWLLQRQIESTRDQIRIVEAERDAARRAIQAMESEAIRADARNRAAITGKEAINEISEGKDSAASETLLKSLQIANEIGGLK